MEKKTLKLISKRVNNQCLIVLNGNTVMFEYGQFEGQKPDAIEIKVFRAEKINFQNMPMQAMGGNFPLNGAFSIYNTNGNERKQGDGVLTDEIYNVCLAIFNNDIKFSE